MIQNSSDVYNFEQPVRAFAKKTLVGVDRKDAVQKAAKRMNELGISSLVVTDQGEIVGFFTDSDINRKVVAEGLSPDTPVENIMNTELITLDIEASVKEAIELMSENSIKHLLITSKGKIIAILTFGDIIAEERHMIGTHISRE